MITGVKSAPVTARTPVGGSVRASDPTLGLDRPNLALLAALTGAADQVMLWTAVDAMATFTVTPFVRTFLDDTTAAAVRGTLGLGSASTAALDTDGTLTANSDAVVPSQKATKSYVDTLIASNVHWKSPVRAATTAALPANTYAAGVITATANGALAAQDGVTLVLNDSLLVKDEGTQTKNGIYTLTQVGDAGNPWKLTRRFDVDADAEVPGATCVALGGTANVNTQWTCSNSSVTLGTTAITFVQLGGASGTYTAGFGLGLTGTQFSITNVAIVAVAGLTPLADTIGYFDSGTTAARTAFTAKGRELAGAADAAAVRTAAALGSAATQASTAFDAAGVAATLSGTAQTNAQTYADAADRQGAAKADVRYATAAALPANTYVNGTAGVGATLTATANGALTVDGSSPTAGERVLVKDEATTSHNGLFTVTAAGGVSSAFVLTRATDFDQPAVGVTGARVRVQAGTTNAGTTWELTTNASITYGTTGITFASMVNSIGGAASTGTGGVARATSPTLITPNLGTPSAVVLTNASGTAAGLTAGNATLAATVTTNANLTGPVTSVGNATSIAAQTGTGTTFVVSVSPALTGTPTAPTAAAGTNTQQLATTAFVIAAVTGLFDYKGGIDASANPNYPAASKGDVYKATVAGRVGGASGKQVDVGDMIVANADNAGGNEATVGASWDVYEHNLVGAILAANNLSDLANAATARGNLGLAALAIKATVAAGDIDPNAVTLAKLDASSATANKVLMSGASASPTWSTPAYPNASAAAGKVIISDGTNYVASTPTYPNAAPGAGKVLVGDGTNFVLSTPTFPNASATARKVIVSDGTNWVASTELHPVPGTSGNVMLSNGTDWTSAVLPTAVQADQEAATSTTTFVTPGRQQFHPSAAKCWGFTTGAGTPVLNAASYNVTSITDTAVGRLTVTIGTDFSTANWAGIVSTTNATAALKLAGLVTKAAGSVILESGTAAATLADPGVGWEWAFMGDQ